MYYSKGTVYEVETDINLDKIADEKDKKNLKYLVNNNIEYVFSLRGIDENHCLCAFAYENKRKNAILVYLNNGTQLWVYYSYFIDVNYKYLSRIDGDVINKQDFINLIYNNHEIKKQEAIEKRKIKKAKRLKEKEEKIKAKKEKQRKRRIKISKNRQKIIDGNANAAAMRQIYARGGFSKPKTGNYETSYLDVAHPSSAGRGNF